MSSLVLLTPVSVEEGCIPPLNGVMHSFLTFVCEQTGSTCACGRIHFVQSVLWKRIMFELGWRTLSVGFLLIFSLYRKYLSCSRERSQKKDKDCAKKLRKIPRSPLRSSQGTYRRRNIKTEEMKCYILLRARVPSTVRGKLTTLDTCPTL